MKGNTDYKGNADIASRGLPNAACWLTREGSVDGRGDGGGWKGRLASRPLDLVRAVERQLANGPRFSDACLRRVLHSRGGRAKFLACQLSLGRLCDASWEVDHDLY